MNELPLTLFFDGGCHLCSREIDYYRKRIAGPVAFVDINDPAFDAARYGVEAKAFHRVMHVRVGDEMRTAVPAFAAIWERVPGQHWMARLARTPGFRGLMTVAYHTFAWVRPLLPRRRRDACDTGTCPR